MKLLQRGGLYLAIPGTFDHGGLCSLMVGSGHRHHLPAIVHPVISLRKAAPVVQILQYPYILLRHVIALTAMFPVHINVFPVNAYYPCRILGPFHPALDLHRCDPGVDQIRNQIYGTQILHTEQIS